ncbi:MAG: transcription elongation factor GreA [Anaerolineaceae bacterium]|nr:transcription elongation factor GreA [Anaerolineaceae bacterium]
MNETATQFLTAEGAAALQSELQQLREVRRPELAKLLKTAVAQGDLKENADYHDAREQQGFVERRISFLEDTLRSAQVIEKEDTPAVVGIGCRVTIQEKGEAGAETYRIVGAAEANPREGKISYESPLGKALMGLDVGARVKVETPEGMATFRIRAIE